MTIQDTTDPTVEETLLQAIKHDRDHDSARLVYADYLSERGDPRGELISIQCQLEEVTRNGNEPDAKLLRLQNKILRDLAASWDGPWKLKQGLLSVQEEVDSWYGDTETMKCHIRRGFITGVESHPNIFKSRIDWLVENAPLLDSLAVKTLREELPVKELFALISRLPILHSYTMGFWSSADDQLTAIGSVANDQCFNGLQHLSLQGLHVEDVLAHTELLGKSEGLRALGSLDLYDWRMPADALTGLVNAKFRPHTLLLNRNEIGAEGAQILAADETWEKTKTLGLFNNGIGPAGVTAITTSKTFRRLESLDLRSNRIGEAGAQALGEAKSLGKLEHLVLVGNTLKPEALAGLCGPGLKNLKDLNLQNTRLTDEAIDAMVAAKDFPAQLRRLNLASNKLSGQSIKRLAESAAFANLECLVLDKPLHKVAGRVFPGAEIADKPKSW